MNKIKKLLLLILACSVFGFMSCGNPAGDGSGAGGESTSGSESSSDSQSGSEVYSKIGDVNKIYKGESITARFYTGQIIKNAFGCEEALFEGVLVEYNSLAAEVVSYVSGLKQANAYVHQNYEDVVYDENKIYAEFSTYYNNSNKEVIAHEVRVFSGDFLNKFDGSSYAKSVTFDPSMTIDIERSKNVYTGETTEYKSDYSFNTYISCSFVTDFPEEFSKFGTIESVYVEVDSNNEIYKGEMNSEQYYINYYVEYEDFDSVTSTYYENRKNDFVGFNRTSDFYINPDKKYIHFYYIFNNDTDEEVSGHAIIADSKDSPGLYAGVELKNINFWDEYPDLYTYMTSLKETKLLEITDYPEVMSKFGELDNVRAYVTTDGKIVSDYQNKNKWDKCYIGEYSSFTDATKKVLKNAIGTRPANGPLHDCLFKEGKKYVVYWSQFIKNADGTDVEIYHICNLYDPDVVDSLDNILSITDDGCENRSFHEDLYAHIVEMADSED